MALLSQTAHADVYAKSAGMNGLGVNETWVSGKKRREAATANLGGFRSSTITITRVDKGLVWEVDDDLQVYLERPIRLEDEPGDEEIPAEWKARPNEKWIGLPQEAEDYCSPQVQTLPQKQAIAGFEAAGYYAVCPGQRPATTMWLAPAQGALAQFDRDTKNFEKAYRDELYKEMSPAERKAMEETLQAFGSSAGQMLAGMRLDKLPKGVALKIEQEGEMPNGNVGKNVMVEILEIRAGAADPALFEIPGGYRRVTADELSMLKGQKTARQMGMGDMYGQIMALQGQMQGQMPGGAGQDFQAILAEAMPENTPEAEE